MGKSGKLSIGKAEMGEDRIIWVAIRPGARIGEKEAFECRELAARMIDGRPHALLVDLSDVGMIDESARKILSTPVDENHSDTVAVAIVVRSAVSRLIANFFLGSNRPRRPIRLFNKCEPAVKWLHEHLDRAFAPRSHEPPPPN